MTRDDNLDADFGRSAEPGQDIEAHAAAGNNAQWPPLEASYGTGWQPIIDTLAADLAVIDPDLSVNQVKEKFGGLRVYVSATPAHHDAVYARIEQAEQDAERTCERCGQPGQLNDDLHWVLTLCDACSDLRAAERAAQWRQQGGATRTEWLPLRARFGSGWTQILAGLRADLYAIDPELYIMGGAGTSWCAARFGVVRRSGTA
ncbi:hypothetical protein H8Z59_24625 [Mycolicibacterium fortuitum]|uniref:hypothetical protein n=1 Tax=Mycolicibacterium fortuitum TaxID=1766 RepID=UPI001CDC311E|nr:hypothetical protein [Mycolicibacterium fortuitum]UBV20419.1 hypothetical protein H8Z59_24625 [Mycolicibacterium fortuitum]